MNPVSQLRLGDWLHEIIRGVVSRPARVALTIAGTVMGTATLVAVLGLTASAQGQVSDRFSPLRATQVDVKPLDATFGDGGFPRDAETRVAQIRGVQAVGLAWEVPAANWDSVSALPPGSGGTAPTGIGLHAVSPGMLKASRAQLSAGRTFDDWCVKTSCRAAVLGKVAAQRLGIGTPRPGQAVFIAGVPFTVLGVVDDVKRNPELLGSVMVPTATARDMWGEQNLQPWMTIDTAVGAADVAGRQVPIALRAAKPAAYELALPPDPRSLQASVGNDIGGLFLALTGITLLVGAFGIANLTTVAVLQRVAEIGLRRALGARPIHIAAQFVGESSVLGLVGGLIGTPLGVFTVLAVCWARDWTALLPPWLMATPLLGLAVGLLAGLQPAARAARIEPATALQR
ncbi:ABC transporter permease [Luteococcus sp. H138]|uniref:ABC transporter permease n=1 Tax=unclassified Luteococcus TaxID=2639923 RepID=UPI00313DB709